MISQLPTESHWGGDRRTPSFILYNGWRDNRFELVTSLEQLDELDRVLSYEKLKRYISRHEARLILNTIGACAEILETIPEIDLSPDPDDNKIIATAIEGAVDYLVSGDKKDLLSLGSVNNIPVVTAREAATALSLIVSILIGRYQCSYGEI